MQAATGNEPVSFRDAIGNVEVLDEIPLPDSQPCIEAASLPIQYRVSFDTNFQDKNAFITGNSKYVEEATRHAEFVSCCILLCRKPPRGIQLG